MQFFKISLGLCALALCGAVTLHAQDNAAQAAARAALLKKLQEAPGAPAPEAPAPAPAAPAVTPPAEAPAAPPAAPVAPVETAPVAGDNPAQATARAALLQKLAEGGVPTATATAAPAGPGKVTVAAVALPAAPQTKEQKLQLLLVQYKKDQITPLQYHEQRAAILAGP
jgi:hypothetical protein